MNGVGNEVNNESTVGVSDKFVGFQSASGAQIQVSDKALKVARAKMKKDTLIETPKNALHSVTFYTQFCRKITFVANLRIFKCSQLGPITS